MIAPRAVAAAAAFAAVCLAGWNASAQTPSSDRQPPPGFTPAQSQPTPPPGFTPAPAPTQPSPGSPPPGYPAPTYSPPPAYVQNPPSDGPEVMTYNEGEPPPPGYHYDEAINRGFVIAGAVLFGATYLVTSLSGLLAGAVADVAPGGTSSDDFVPMYVPVAGPFVTMRTTDANATGILALGLLGLSQTAGVALFVSGFVVPQKRWLRNDLALVPSVGPSAAGLTLAGPM